MNYKDDTYCIERIIQGEVQAFTYLVERYKKQVYTFALKMVKVPEDAEEIAHDAFVKAYQSLKTFRQDSKFSTWLYRIVFNISVSRLRKKNLVVNSIDDSPLEGYDLSGSESPFNVLSDREQCILVRNAVDRLPEDERAVIILFYLNDCSVKEIVKITNFTEANVKIKLFRARKKLSEMLKFLYSEQIVKEYDRS